MDVPAIDPINGTHDPWAVWQSAIVQSAAMAAAYAGTNPAIIAHAPALAKPLANAVPDDEVASAPAIGTEVDRYA